MSGWMSVETVFFTVLGYPMSFIEFVGTMSYLMSVWLIIRRNILTWPIGLVSVALFMALFFQIHLYADAMEQVYYLAASAYGWWSWSRSVPIDRDAIDVRFSAPWPIAFWLAGTALGSLLFGAAVARIHEWLPNLFPEPASLPFLDAATTVMSFSAMALMALRRIEAWVYWILVDIVGIGLYFAKGVKFVSVLYVVLLGMAVAGLFAWRKARGALLRFAGPDQE